MVLLCLIGENGGRNGAGSLKAVVVFCGEKKKRYTFCFCFCFREIKYVWCVFTLLKISKGIESKEIIIIIIMSHLF